MSKRHPIVEVNGQQSKECNSCHIVKPLTEFHRESRVWDGRVHYCKGCNYTKYRAWNRKQKEDVINHYGNRCACCGETELVFLAIDHIDGGGYKQRKGMTVNHFKWFKDNDFPDGFQVLCHNCNMAKAIDGECPHQESSISLVS